MAQTSRLMGVSERSVRMVKRAVRLRPDLGPALRAGTISIREALRIAEGRAKPTSWDRLMRAWNAATEDDRGRLALIILCEAEESRQ